MLARLVQLLRNTLAKINLIKFFSQLNFKLPLSYMYFKKLDRTPKTKLARLVKIAKLNLITPSFTLLSTRLSHPSLSLYKGHYLFSAPQITLTNWTARQKVRKAMTYQRVFRNSPDHDQNTTIVSIGNGPIALLYSSFMFFATLTIATALAHTQTSYSPPSSPRFLRP